MYGIPRREEIRRYRAMWWRWGKADHLGRLVTTDPARRLRQRRREADATGRAGRRAQLPVPHALRDL